MDNQEVKSGYPGISSAELPVDSVHLITEDFAWNGNKSGWDKVTWYRREKPHPLDNPYVTAERHDPQTGWHVRMWRRRLYVEGSLPRLKNPQNNTHPLLETDWILVTRYLVDLQGRLGLSFSNADLRLARVDIFRNLEVQYPAAIIVGRLSSILDIGNLHQTARPALYGAPYIRWGNGDRELVIYEKNIVAGSGDFTKDGWRLRFEYRLRRESSCRRSGLSTFVSLFDCELLNSILDRQLSSLFRQVDKRALFSNSDGAMDTSIILTKTIGSRGFRVPELSKVVAGLGGIERVLGQLGGERTLHDLAKDLGVPRHTRDRMKRTLAEMVRVSNLLRTKEKTKSFRIRQDLMSLLVGRESLSCAPASTIQTEMKV